MIWIFCFDRSIFYDENDAVHAKKELEKFLRELWKWREKLKAYVWDRNGVENIRKQLLQCFIWAFVNQIFFKKNWQYNILETNRFFENRNIFGICLNLWIINFRITLSTYMAIWMYNKFMQFISHAVANFLCRK